MLNESVRDGGGGGGGGRIGLDGSFNLIRFNLDTKILEKIN